MIVDRDLIVRALSRRAEALLAVDEPAAVHTPLDALLVCDDRDADDAELGRLIGLSLAHTPTSDTVSLRNVADPLVRFQARVTSCGPPSAAVLILAPVRPKLTAGETNGSARPRARRSSNGGRATERRHGRRRPPMALGAPGSRSPVSDLRRNAGLDLLIRHIARSVQSEVALFYRLNGDGDAATLIASWGLDATRPPTAPPVQAGFVGGALVSGRAALGPLDPVHDGPLITAPADGRLSHAATAPVRSPTGSRAC